MNLISASVVVIIGCIIGAFGSLYLKKGADKASPNLFKLITNYEIILGIMFYAVSVIMFIFALKGNPLSIIYPLVSTSYIWIAFFSIRFLDERMNLMKWLGIFYIVFGVVCIGIGG